MRLAYLGRRFGGFASEQRLIELITRNQQQLRGEFRLIARDQQQLRGDIRAVNESQQELKAEFNGLEGKAFAANAINVGASLAPVLGFVAVARGLGFFEKSKSTVIGPEHRSP